MFDPRVGKIPWRRKGQPTPVPLPGKSHGRRSLVSYSPWGCKELDTTEWLHFLSFIVVLLLVFSQPGHSTWPIQAEFSWLASFLPGLWWGQWVGAPGRGHTVGPRQSISSTLCLPRYALWSWSLGRSPLCGVRRGGECFSNMTWFPLNNHGPWLSYAKVTQRGHSSSSTRVWRLACRVPTCQSSALALPSSAMFSHTQIIYSQIFIEQNSHGPALMELTGENRKWMLTKGGSDGKESPWVLEARVPTLDLEDLLQMGMATHSSILAWRISHTEEPDRLQFMGLQRVGHILAPTF